MNVASQHSSGADSERRKQARLDPYEVLVAEPSDIIGLVAYSIFREKKKKLLEGDSGDRSRHFFFDSTIGEYEDELRAMAMAWYHRFYAEIALECSERNIEETRDYINLKFNEIAANQKKFRWLESILSSVFATFTYVIILIVAAYVIKFHISSFDLIAFAADKMGIILSK